MAQLEIKVGTIVAFQNRGNKKTILGRIINIKLEGLLYHIEDKSGNVGIYSKEQFIPLIQSNMVNEFYVEIRVNNQKIIDAMLNQIGNLIGI